MEGTEDYDFITTLWFAKKSYHRINNLTILGYFIKEGLLKKKKESND